MAAPFHLHPTEHSTSLAGPASLGWNVANLGVDTIQLQLGESLATPAGVAITPGPTPFEEMGAGVGNQVAAPAEMRTPTCTE